VTVWGRTPSWCAEFDPIPDPNGLSRYPSAVNRVDIEFIRPVFAGERISPTCTVERVTRNADPESYLTITCRKD